MAINIYLDDVRPGFSEEIVGWEDWVVVRSVDTAKQLLMNCVVQGMSLDHDMGTNSHSGQLNPTGYDLLKWMIEHDCKPQGKISVHSGNPVGANTMREFIKRYLPDNW